MKDKPYGSGSFGEWITDTFELPAYRYICDQINDPKAVTPMNDLWHPKTDHFFLVGNDRIVGVASNFGYIKIRQDEGSPKYLNYYVPEEHQYAGGFGYLTDGKITISTFYTEQNKLEERIFGVGYFQKRRNNKAYSIDQIICAPFGDDPIVISQVTITNNSDEHKMLKWFEYWGCFNFQFSFQAVLEALTQKDVNRLKNYRIEFEKKFKNKFMAIEDQRGIINFKYDLNSSDVSFQKDYKKRKNGEHIKKKRPTFEDDMPPPIFLASLDGKVQGCFTDARQFFGENGVHNPIGLNSEGGFDLDTEDFQNCMVLQKNFELNPKESTTLTFIYGYIPEGYQLDHLFQKYTEEKDRVLEKSSKLWKINSPNFIVNEYDWITRETLWNYYYLRGGLSYDDFFIEHILSQGHVYQYIIGFQGAARDPLQHAMPFLYSNPEIVKEIIRYTCKEVKKNGQIPYGITGNGMIMPSPWEPSDLEMWLLWLTSEYVISSKDTKFLEEKIPFYPIHKTRSKTQSILDFLHLTFQHFTEKTGRGVHGLQRVSSCDWNDMIITGYVPDDLLITVKRDGESVLNSAMAIYVLSLFADLMDLLNDSEIAEKSRNYAKNLKIALLEQWNGKWFKRAWLTESLGWVGDKKLWLEPQPWAIISEVLDKEKEAILIQNIDKMLRQPSKLGAILQSSPIESTQELPGMGTNAGIWYSINGTLIWALRKVNINMAWDEFIKNTLSYRATQYPNIWYGIWSGADTINSVFSEYPGEIMFNKYYKTRNLKDKEAGLVSMGINWTDFPVLNLHPHAWPLFNITHLLGIEFTIKGINIHLDFPINQYEFSSKLCGLKKNQEGYSGWYNPIVKGEWIIQLELPEKESFEFNTLVVNSVEKPLNVEDCRIIFSGDSSSEKGIQWQLKKQ